MDKKIIFALVSENIINCTIIHKLYIKIVKIQNKLIQPRYCAVRLSAIINYFNCHSKNNLKQNSIAFTFIYCTIFFSFIFSIAFFSHDRNFQSITNVWTIQLKRHEKITYLRSYLSALCRVKIYKTISLKVFHSFSIQLST